MVVISSLYIWPLALFSTCMFVVHLFLAITNTTTFEVSGGADKVDYLKGTKECDLPFSKVSSLARGRKKHTPTTSTTYLLPLPLDSPLGG